MQYFQKIICGLERQTASNKNANFFIQVWNQIVRTNVISQFSFKSTVQWFLCNYNILFLILFFLCVCTFAQHLFVLLCLFICLYVHKHWELANSFSWNCWIFLWKTVRPLQYCLWSDSLIATLHEDLHSCMCLCRGVHVTART